MSRIGKQPVPLPEGVTASITDQVVTVRGSKGELTYTVHPRFEVALAENALTVKPRGQKETKQTGALWGTMRAQLANLVQGVHIGFKKQLELHGVGYRAAVKGKNLELAVGFSHPVIIEAREGISFTVDKESITVEGIDAYQVGQVAANIREVRKPEPYKGKGIRYVGEQVRRKVGKVVGTTE